MIPLFTWSQGDGGPSEHAAPDGGVGAYWLQKEDRMLTFEEYHKDKEIRHMQEVLWDIGEMTPGNPAPIPRW